MAMHQMTMQTTLILFKPDAIDRRMVGQLIQRFENKGLKIVGLKMMQVNKERACEHYAEHADRDFFEGLISFMTSGPVVVLALNGLSSISVCRGMIGLTCGIEAKPGTIRGDYCQFRTYNLIHASDSPASANRELKLWFNDFSALFSSLTVRA